MAKVIKLEEGYKKVYENGIQPFFKFLEDQDDKNFFTAKEFITYYDLVYQMANQPAPNDYSAQLYEKYSSIIHEYCTGRVREALERAKHRFDTAFLGEWRLRWKKFKQATMGVRHVFQYLDRFFTKEKEGTLDLIPQAYKIFKEQVFDRYAPIARGFIIAAVEKERNGEPQDHALLRDAVTVFVEMGQNWRQQKLNLYRDELEKQIVADAGTYYKRHAPTWVEEDSTPVYLEKAERKLAEETKRVQAYLNSISLEPLLSECYTHLLKAQQRDLLEKKTGIRAILDANSKVDLARFYALYKRAPEDLVPIANAMEAYISEAGKSLVEQAKPAKAAAAKKPEAKGDEKEKKEGEDEEKSEGLSGLQLVQSLIALHARFAHIVDSCFGKNLVFQKALKTAFTEFINADARVSTLLAQFGHDLLQKGSKFRVEDLDDTLDQLVFIYGYIREKDIFEHEYQKYLAQRLLEGTSRSEHTEKSLIGKLKVEAGYSWVNKLEGMFKDVASSVDLNNTFRAANSGATAGMDLHVTVCSKANWPPTQQLHGKIPSALQSPCDAFRKYYKEKQAMHKIEWMWDMGQAEVQVLFRPGYPRTLFVSTLQMMILLVFNNPSKASGIVTTQEICDVTGVPLEGLADALVSLAMPKVEILEKNPKGYNLEAEHKFRINPKYQNQLRRVIVPYRRGIVPIQRAVQTGPKPIDLARQHMIDAALVRVMKVRQTMKHAQLTAEVISQLKQRFDPKPVAIRKRIDHLIDCPEPYMKRDENDRSILHYVP